MLGAVPFESLVDLINYYEKHPLYRKICLCRPVNEEIVARIGVVSTKKKIIVYSIVSF